MCVTYYLTHYDVTCALHLSLICLTHVAPFPRLHSVAQSDEQRKSDLIAENTELQKKMDSVNKVWLYFQLTFSFLNFKVTYI